MATVINGILSRKLLGTGAARRLPGHRVELLASAPHLRCGGFICHRHHAAYLRRRRRLAGLSMQP